MINQNALNGKANKPTLFMFDYYNVKTFNKFLTKGESTPAIARVVNVTIKAVNVNNGLPCYLIIVLDSDILFEMSTFEFGAHKELLMYINWVTKQIDIIIRRKKLQLLNKKPGAILDSEPTTIYVNMVKHIEHYPEQSKMAKMCTLCGKFNDLLNNSAAKKNNRILSIRSLNSHQNFDARGSLSRAGKDAFWWELDDLIQKFESNKVKLLPRIKCCAPQDSYTTSNSHSLHGGRDKHERYSDHRTATARCRSPKNDIEEYYTKRNNYPLHYDYY